MIGCVQLSLHNGHAYFVFDDPHYNAFALSDSRFHHIVL